MSYEKEQELEREKILLGLELKIQEVSNDLEAHGGRLTATELFRVYFSALEPGAEEPGDYSTVIHEGVKYHVKEPSEFMAKLRAQAKDSLWAGKRIPYDINGGDLIEGDNFNGAWEKVNALDTDITCLRDYTAQPSEYPEDYDPYKREGRPKTDIYLDLKKIIEGLDKI